MAKSFPEAWSAQSPRLGPGPAASGQGLSATSFPFGKHGFVMNAVAANHSLATLYTRKQVEI